MITKIKQSQRPAETRCVFCHGEFVEEEELPCKCGALYHQDCFETYGCGTIGCSGTIVTKTQLSEVARQLRADVRTTPLGIVSFIWLLGASIIGLLTALCFAFHQSILALPLLLAGTIISYIFAFTFRRKAHKAQLEKSTS